MNFSLPFTMSNRHRTEAGLPPPQLPRKVRERMRMHEERLILTQQGNPVHKEPLTRVPNGMADNDLAALLLWDLFELPSLAGNYYHFGIGVATQKPSRSVPLGQYT